MSGRRSHVRFIVTPPSSGVVRLLSDAEIDSVGHDGMLIISRETARIDEHLILELPRELGELQVPVTVTESRPAIVGGAVRHALRLQVLDRASARDDYRRLAQALNERPRGHRPAPYSDDQRLVTVARELPVRLVNCSRSGCLLEVDRPLEIGTAGTLLLSIDGHELADHVLVVRCQGIAGAGPVHHVGARLLWVETPSAHTIRRGLAPVENPV